MDPGSSLLSLVVGGYSGSWKQNTFHGAGKAHFRRHRPFVFNGTFVDGFPEGAGSFEWLDGVVYEGDVSRTDDGCELNGKATYRWPNGSSYVGEVRNGLRHGKGTYTAADGITVYEGGWKAGNKHGEGTIWYDAQQSIYYKGQWQNNHRHGHGEATYPSGSLYKGEWVQGKRHGEGEMLWKDRHEEYSGEWENGEPHGYGTHRYFCVHTAQQQLPPPSAGGHKQADKLNSTAQLSSIRVDVPHNLDDTTINVYEGEFDKGLRHGFGVFFYADGSRYEGEWSHNLKEGEGRYFHVNGDVHVGTFKNNRMVDEATKMGALNTFIPLYITDLLYLEDNPDDALERVHAYVARKYGLFRRVFQHYSRTGDISKSHANSMTMLQFWKFTKDTKLQHGKLSLASIDRIFLRFKDIITPTCASASPMALSLAQRMGVLQHETAMESKQRSSLAAAAGGGTATSASTHMQEKAADSASPKTQLPRRRNKKKNDDDYTATTTTIATFSESGKVYDAAISEEQAIEFARHKWSGANVPKAAHPHNILAVSHELPMVTEPAKKRKPKPQSRLWHKPPPVSSSPVPDLDAIPLDSKGRPRAASDVVKAKGKAREDHQAAPAPREKAMTPPPALKPNEKFRKFWEQMQTSDIHNPDAHAIMFRDFVEAVVRLAFIKYSDCCPAVNLFNRVLLCLENDIVPNTMKETALLLQELPEVAKVVKELHSQLRALFRFYTHHNYHNLDGARCESISDVDRTITVRQFLTLLKENKVLDRQLGVVTVLTLFDHDGVIRTNMTTQADTLTVHADKGSDSPTTTTVPASPAYSSSALPPTISSAVVADVSTPLSVNSRFPDGRMDTPTKKSAASSSHTTRPLTTRTNKTTKLRPAGDAAFYEDIKPATPAKPILTKPPAAIPENMTREQRIQYQNTVLSNQEIVFTEFVEGLIHCSCLKFNGSNNSYDYQMHSNSNSNLHNFNTTTTAYSHVNQPEGSALFAAPHTASSASRSADTPPTPLNALIGNVSMFSGTLPATLLPGTANPHDIAANFRRLLNAHFLQFLGEE